MNLDPRRPRPLSGVVDDRSTSTPTATADPTGRRGFLVKAAVLPALAVGASLLPGTVLASVAAAAEMASPELTFTEFAVSLELALAELYGTALKGTTLSEANKDLANACITHHNAHASTMSTLVTAGGGEVPTAGNVGLLAKFTPQVGPEVAEAALVATFGTLEEAMAATYLASLDTVASTAIASTVATIIPVEGQHAVVWSAAAAGDATKPGQPEAGTLPVEQTETGQLSEADNEISAPTTTAPATTAPATTKAGS